ncbi:MAG: ribosome maturation factor RimP [Rhodospirillaceae bacterium]|nr:ribosome maturation factor RimP [Rhodospirillaceae bacterium]
MDATDRIERLIAPTLDGMGYDLVRVALIGSVGRQTLQIMAERRDRAGMTVEDCADISRAVSALLDVEDPISSSYTLEVSSPGIDRPLTRLDDFSRFAGFEAKVELSAPVEGRKRFRGRIKGVAGERVLIETEDGEADVPFGRIQKAKLVLTDELLAAAAKEGMI